MKVRDVAAAAGVTVRALHHFEQVGLLTPTRSTNGYRSYGPDDLRRVELIRRFQSVGFSLAEIGELAPCFRAERVLSNGHDDDVRSMYAAKLAEIDDKVAALEVVRNELRERLKHLPSARRHKQNG